MPRIILPTILSPLTALILALPGWLPAADPSIWVPRGHNPSFAEVGKGFTAEVRAATTLAANGWSASVRNDLRSWACTVSAATGSIHHGTESGWRLTITVPAAASPELLDLEVRHSTGLVLQSARSLRAVTSFEEDFYIVQLTDQHINGTTAVNAKGGTSNDGSSDSMRWQAPVVNLINPRFVAYTGDNITNFWAGSYGPDLATKRARLDDYQAALGVFRVPTVVGLGNHDIGYLGGEYAGGTYVDPAVWRQEYEARVGQRCFSFRMGSFYVINNEWTINGSLPWLSWATGDYTAAYADSAVTYRLVLQHYLDKTNFPNWIPVPAGKPCHLALGGHTHGTGKLQTSPYPFLTTGTAKDYQRAAYFSFQRSGSGWTCPQATTHANGVNVFPLVGDWGAPKVSLAYAATNDGTKTTNTATIVNSLPLNYYDGRVRFLMAKGSYTVNGGTVLASYDDTSGTKTAVLVKVNIAKSATTTVTIVKNQTTVPPAITTQPVGRTVNAGQTATFTVAATGTPAPTYQWQKNNANISGATAASYTTPATVAGDHGAAFRCIVTNSAGTRTSNAATLTVNVAPAITIQPVAQTRGVGQTATFSVAASGRPAPTFQWQKNGAVISGATAASYTTPALTAADHGAQYRCVASNSVGTATSAAATVTMSGIGWQGTYYDNRDFTGAQVERTDLAIAFDWGANAPMTGMGVDGFSVRWRGMVVPAYSQTYTFTATCDDGVRVWVGGRKVIDRWTDSSATASAGQVNLTAGVPVLVVMEYYENAGSASATLSWQSASQAAQTIPHTAVVPATGEDLPGGWTAQDVGAVGLAGTTTEAGGTWTLTGSGADIWNASDEFRFVWQQVSGDVRITARVASLTNTNPWSKAGVMVRESLAPGARHAFTCVTPGNGVAFQRRLTANAASSHTACISRQAPYWVRVERIGDVLIGSCSPDGATWTEIRRETIALETAVYVGLALTSHDDAVLATAGFSAVQITVAGSAAN